jgi:putative transposase
MTVNHKKIYRLCKENNLLLKRKKKIKKFKKLAENHQITGPNQLWQFDIKYGYIQGEDRPFYFLAFVDIFTKRVLSYHIGKACTASDMKLTLKMALNSVTEEEQKNLTIRSDNGPQLK